MASGKITVTPKTNKLPPAKVTTTTAWGMTYPVPRQNRVQQTRQPLHFYYQNDNHMSCQMLDCNTFSNEEELQDCFEIVRDRIRASQGRVRKSGADYLTYLSNEICLKPVTRGTI